ncbi:hypothetical protein PAXRUDRAFT_144066, partial [Paxillus rubicundulus Ve08.2h10]
LTSFDPKRHIKRSDIHIDHDHNGIEILVLHIPQTKTNWEGEDLSFLRQVPNDPTDPWTTLDNHFTVNNPPHDLPLFSYHYLNTHRTLMKSEVSKAASLEPLQGHGMQIGGMLKYLLHNVSFKTVKAKGHWKSDAFQLYLRKHAQILTVHMQKHLALHEEFVCYTMPLPAPKNPSKSPLSSYSSGLSEFCSMHCQLVALLLLWGSQLTSSHRILGYLEALCAFAQLLQPAHLLSTPYSSFNLQSIDSSFVFISVPQRQQRML